MTDESDVESIKNTARCFFFRPIGEATFCFDTSETGPEYPIWHHHQDSTRANRFVTGGWAKPDFANFIDWFEWFVQTIESAPTWDDVFFDYPSFSK